LCGFSSERPWVSEGIPEQSPNKVNSNTGTKPAQYAGEQPAFNK
jgi:hypothetical protein